MRIAKPLARTEDLVIEEVEDEVLIFDPTSHRAHCLGATAARVWRACDGNSDVSALSDTLDLSVDVVTQALDELEALNLLDSQGLDVVHSNGGNGHAKGNGITRRQFGTKSAAVGAGVAAVPLVLSVNVSPAAALTATPFTCGLYSARDCGESSGCGAVNGCCCCCTEGSARPAPQPLSATTPRHRAVSVPHPRGTSQTVRTTRQDVPTPAAAAPFPTRASAGAPST